MTEKDSSEQGFEAGKAPEERQEDPPTKKSGGFLEFLIIVLVAFALVFGFVRPFVLEAFYIPSESMVPTLEVGDRVFVNKFIYRFSKPERGDIIVFQSVEAEDQTLIKRVVGVEGDEIRVQSGLLFVNGEAQNEPYLNDAGPSNDFYGPLPLENVEGEAFLRFWPLSKIGTL